MACKVCINQTEAFSCQFSLETALENIRKHYTKIETALQQKSDEVNNLKERNDKLMKAIDCLKNPTTLTRLNSFSEQFDRSNVRRTNTYDATSDIPVPSPIFEDITVIDDEDEDNTSGSVMDTALNGSALNTTANNDIITETEYPESRGTHIRRLGLKLKSKTTAVNRKTSTNDENAKPATHSSVPQPPTTSPTNEGTKIHKQSEWANKQKEEIKNKSQVRRLSLKQTRLYFDEKRERSPKGGAPIRTLTLGDICKKKEENVESDEDLFNLNATATFQFKSPTPKKSKLNDSNTNYFSSPKSQDNSVMAIPSPTQTIYFLDDTTDAEKEHVKRITTNKAIDKSENDNLSDDSLADFELPTEITSRSYKPTTEKLKTITRQLLPPIPKVKEEPITQPKVKKPVNMVYKDSDTAEESDDDFIVRPIQIKMEPEQKKHIDIDSIDCMDCRNYIKFCGARMTADKLEEHIRNCVYHNKRDELRAETPDGFWNPLLLSFNSDDPRNEVLVDNRFVNKNTAPGVKHNS